MSDQQPSISQSGSVRKSARLAAQPAPQQPRYNDDSDNDDEVSDDDGSDNADNESEDAYSAIDENSASELYDDNTDDAEDVGLEGRDPTRRSSRKPAVRIVDPRAEAERLKAEKAKRLPEFLSGAWKLAHAPRKCIKRDGTMERSWMNRMVGFMFKNNNSRLRTTSGMEFYTTRVVLDQPRPGPQTKARYGDWSNEKHGENELNLKKSYVKWLWDDGMPGQSVKEPLKIEDRQAVRCDENFAVHPHGNDTAHPAGFVCCESRESHFELYMKLRREEILQEEEHDNSEGFEGGDDNQETPSQKKSRRARTQLVKRDITYKRLKDEIYEWEANDFVICTECDDKQIKHLSRKAAGGHFDGALLPLCDDCAVASLDNNGWGCNGCTCDLEHRCLYHRINHLEELHEVRSRYIKSHQVEQSGGVERTPLCPRCQKKVPPAVPTHFAYNCVRCHNDVVIPAPEDLEGQREFGHSTHQFFVRNLDRPNKQMLDLIQLEWNERWIAYFRRFASQSPKGSTGAMPNGEYQFQQDDPDTTTNLSPLQATT